MEEIKDINLKIINDKDNLEFNIKGNNIDYVLMNGLRRTIYTDIPIYAFDEINIDINTSIFNNTYLKNRLKNMPVYGIENDITFYNEEKQEEIKNDENNDTEIDIEDNNNINSSSLKQLTMYLHYENKTKSIITVNTNHAKFYYKQKLIDSPYKNPLELIKLQPNQTIKLSAITKLGTEMKNTIYTAVNVCHYNENNENDYNFIVESSGQIKEKKIIHIGIENLIKRLNNISNLLNDEKKEFGNQGVILIDNEDHTIGNLLSRGLIRHKDIEYASYNMDHPLIRKVNLKYKIKKNNIKDILNDVIKYYIKIYNIIKNKI
jgi:DNA-directed RNA polymerase subunit L